MARNTGQTALITGATSGIGYELAKVFGAHGFGLVIVARDTQRLDRVKKEIENSFEVPVEVIAADLSHPRSAREIVDTVKKGNITVDVLVNNAGFNEYGLIHGDKPRKGDRDDPDQCHVAHAADEAAPAGDGEAGSRAGS